VNSRSHRAETAADDLGDLFVAELFEESKGQDLAVHRREGLETCVNSFGVVTGEESGIQGITLE